MTQLDADVAVIGLGAFGSHALWRLAKRGLRVVGFERHSVGHSQGSSHGATRLFRMVSVEHPGLVAMAHLSIGLFRELESCTDQSLLDLSGGIMIGHPQGPLMVNVLAVVEDNRLDHEMLSGSEIAQRFPQHGTVSREHVGVWDPLSGVLRPEASIVAACKAATLGGADVFEQSAVKAIDVGDTCVTVRTSLRSFRVDQVVITTGAWMKVFAPELPTQAHRVPMLWYAPREDVDASEFDLNRFPVFQREVAEGHRLWGHGRVGGMEVKLGPVGDPTRDRRTDPDLVDRGTTPDDWRYVSSLASTELPGLQSIPSRVLPCMTTSTPDGQYVIGRLGSSRVLVGGGGNAHGFKHCSGIGEVLAAQTVGDDVAFDVGYLDPNRFPI